MPPIPKEQRSPYGPVRKRAPKVKHRPAASSSPHRRQGDRASGDDAFEPLRRFLTGPAVCERYGITDMSLWRWLRDVDLGFPQPTLVVRGRRFWDEAILAKWEAQRITRTANPAAA